MVTQSHTGLHDRPIESSTHELAKWLHAIGLYCFVLWPLFGVKKKPCEMMARGTLSYKSEIFHTLKIQMLPGAALCWFQTSLPLCRVIIACCFRVAALSCNAALALSPSGIAPELNRIQLSVICRGGQSGKVIDLLAWRCLPLDHPSAASGACAVEQISSSKRQCGKQQVSLKPALVRTTLITSSIRYNVKTYTKTAKNPWKCIVQNNIFDSLCIFH